ncbi:MAG TPA: hypothetical protein GX497_15360 [Bacillus bacterium]|nr:hypothetical protein [Bacillus sp. (in: firmicutes)]
MHPTEIIELLTISAMITITVIITIFLKGSWRKIGWSLVFSILVAYCIFFVARPYWIDTQIDKKVNLLSSYLEQRYPNEKWLISTVPHREDGSKHLNPYYIGVIFENEPEVTYKYWVENKNNIYQISYSTNNNVTEFKHLEKKIN